MSRTPIPSSDCLCRIVLLGDQRVGKSSYADRLFDEEFNEDYHSTIGVDYRAKMFDFNGKASRVHVFDISGHSDLKSISKSLYEYAQGFIFMYAKDDRASFNSIKEWVQMVNSEMKKGSSAILVANKRDLEDREVTEEEGREFAESCNMHFCEVSSKEDSGVVESLSVLVGNIYRFHESNPTRASPVQKEKTQTSLVPALVLILLVAVSLLM